ncbi:MAG TPA: glycoside hydrolase family 3 N-terminal domain-containing protein [Thermoanaerobaculia bacterium]|jgi:beta-N-acetylhexosaminidase|nr:glycoside hydrolase family 3 N-terminal domain-containing protein [Thermoanaerobaculia bacterium]
MNLNEKAGQLIVAAGTGDELLRLVRERHIGGVIWFQQTAAETAEWNRRLQAASRVPLLISADLESGMGMRFTDTMWYPWPMAIAAAGDPAYAEAVGRVTAREARAIGVNHIFAPVADVNVNPDNPVINTRSFGEDPLRVAEFVTAFIRGVQSEGVLATAKHFPGHGDTHVDSHRSLPTVDTVELGPFRAAIQAGVASVMIGHLLVPGLDDAPATISRRIVDGLLRRELGFDRLVVTDAFNMGGITEVLPPAEAAVRAIEAGVDQIVMPVDVGEAIKAIKAGVPEARIDESVRRILAGKRNVGPALQPARNGADPVCRDWAGWRAGPTSALAEEVAEKAITLVRGGPVPRSAKMVTAVISEYAEEVNPLAELGQSFLLDANATNADAFLAAARDAEVVLLALAVRAKSGAGTIALPELARRTIAQLDAAKCVAISFGSPYIVRELPAIPTFIAAYGIQPVMQRAALRALFGERPMTGRLPVTVTQ